VVYDQIVFSIPSPIIQMAVARVLDIFEAAKQAKVANFLKMLQSPVED